jgi:Pentapeptide repeats (8 copies)
MSETDWLTKAWWFITGHSEAIRDIALTLAAIIGAPLVIWRTWAAHQQSKAALQQSRAALAQAKTALLQANTASQRHEHQTDADRQRRITESFARAIEQLGSEKREVRLGAIYALERIARESPTDHWPIIETLMAYVRERTRLPLDDRQAMEHLEIRLGEPHPAPGPPADVQAALTVVGRRHPENDPDRLRLEFGGTNLSYADLREAHLQKADLSDAFLIGTRMDGARLQDADLRGARLEAAKLEFARLDRVRLDGSYLHRANLRGAVLDTAVLSGACLRGVCLVDADLQKGVVGLTQEQLNEAYGDPVTTKLPDGMTIPRYRAVP